MLIKIIYSDHLYLSEITVAPTTAAVRPSVRAPATTDRRLIPNWAILLIIVAAILFVFVMLFGIVTVIDLHIFCSILTKYNNVAYVRCARAIFTFSTVYNYVVKMSKYILLR